MINESQLKQVRLFQLDGRYEVMGLVRGRTLKGVQLEAPVRIETNYFYPNGDIRLAPAQGMFPYSSGKADEIVTINHRKIISETTPTAQDIEFWLEYLFGDDEEELDDVEDSDIPATGLELC